MMSAMTRNGNSIESPQNWKRSWKRLQLLFRKARTRYIVSVRDKAITFSDGRSTSSAESVPETVLYQNDTRTVQKALVVASKGEYRIRDDFPMPHVGDEEVMIRIHFVGLNPIDWKSVDYNFCLPSFPWVTGREASGEVIQIGSRVEGMRAGDKVWTSTYYRDIRAGCFQEYVVVPAHTVLSVPESIPMEAAACFGVAAMTACMTLWKWLGVPCPDKSLDVSQTIQASQEQDWILIWGGSTTTGQFATQLAVLSGIKVITVNSKQTAELSRKLGAHYVVVRDGKTGEQITDEIRSVAGDNITRSIDVVGNQTAALALQAVSQTRPVGFAPLAMMSQEQRVPANVTVHTVEMKLFILDPASVKYAHKLNQLFADGRIIVPSLKVLDGSFEDIMKGLDTLKMGSMGGKKLIVKM